MQKNTGTISNVEKESQFKQDIEMLFDVASALDYLTGVSEVILTFLENQRKPGRIGFISNVETIYDEKLTAEKIDFIKERRF